MPTAKRQKYLDKIKKKQENFRTTVERQSDIDKIKEEINKIGFPAQTPEIIKFYKILETFVNNSVSVQGKIPIIGYKKIIVYQLTNSKKHEIGARLQHDDNV